MTAKYPVEISDQEGIVDAVNYLLSGPSGLGQNYAGFSSYTNSYIRPTTLQPFTLPINTTLYPSWTFLWTINSITVVGGNPSQFIQVAFTPYLPNVTVTNPPFQYGDRLQITGVTPSFYDDSYTVVSSTTTTVTLSVSKQYTWPSYTSGGQLVRDYRDVAVSTDCNARVTVYGPSDRVFVSAQIVYDINGYDNRTPSGSPTSEPSQYDLVVQINRYRGSPTTSTNDSDFVFSNPVTIAETVVPINTSTSNTGLLVGVQSGIPEIFTTILDTPSFGYYWYILELVWRTVNTKQGTVGTVSFTGTGAGVPGTYTGITPTEPTPIAGSGLTVDVSLTAGTTQPYTTANTTVTIVTGGQSYVVGDQLKIAGNLLGGATPANDMLLTVTEVNGFGPLQPADVTAQLRSLSAQVIKQ